MTELTDVEHGEQVRARLAAATVRVSLDDEDAALAYLKASGELWQHAPADLARLLARAEAAEAAAARLWATWEPYDEDDEGQVPWRLQRDMRAAYADQPAQSQHAHAWREQPLIMGGSRFVCLECGSVRVRDDINSLG